ncbi:hypothetical protein D9756_009787 [Leucocoprinus leucothites]|uniref:Hydrophobic surface binding protein n=1 Tax=Leucocoprinus leucothites TaxID=201217 RepID=A0A8H5CX78_9AGAR|nr:hypothetical protein D9756_009787 [Leucoagaricus leucothites]
MQFKSLVFASLLPYAYASTIPDILNDLAALKTTLVTLDNDINSFPDSGGSLAAALAINDDATAVRDAIDATTPDAVNVDLPVSVDDANTVLAAIQDLQTNIDSSLTGIVEKKPAFDALPVGGISALVAQDLSDINTSNLALEDALIAATPPEVLDAAEETRGEIDSAFATAIAAYS